MEDTMSVSRFRYALLGLTMVSLAAAGCSDDPNDDDTPVATNITMVSGDAQSATISTALTNPLVVKVVDQDGDPFVGAIVTWAVGVGGGTLSQATTTTGNDGTTQVNWTLGAAPGANTATATVTGLPVITFTATGQ